MARFICIAVQLILFTRLLSVESAATDYTVTVTVFPENEPIGIPELVSLECIITPTPPFPVVYIWRSSTQHHTIDLSVSEQVALVTINESQPLFGRYFCHVLSASDYTKLAVGHITIYLNGILRPVEPTNKFFTPPAPLQMEVEQVLLQYQSSQKRLLNSLRNATYEWRHNDTILNDTQNNRLVIPQTSDTDAGTYSVKIVSFGFSNATNPVCAASVLELLRSYAIFRETEFYAYISNSNAPSSTDLSGLQSDNSSDSPLLHHTMKEVLFISGEPLTVDAIIPIQPYHLGVILQFQVPLRLKLFYNGEQLPANSSGNIKHPSEVSSSFIQPHDGPSVSVTLKLPRPKPDDEGLYEMQLFLDFDVSSVLNSLNCSDYIKFLQTPDGLELYEILIGSATLMLHEQGQQGRPQVIIKGTEQIISVNSMKSPPILTCSVIKDGVLFAVNRLRWIKGGKELAQTRVSARLVFDIAISPTTFGLYMCEAINDQSIAQNSILIAERAHFEMELVPINGIRCLDLSKETNELMLDMLLMELQISFSYVSDADFTNKNFASPSLKCSSEGSSILMSTDIIYSNSEGSITASALVETAEEWMNGIRTANGVAFQITRPGTNQALEDKEVAAITVSILIFGVLVTGIIILAIVVCMQRRHLKKQGVNQNYPLPLERQPISEATINKASQQHEAPTQILPKSISYDQLLEIQHSMPHLVDRQGKPLNTVLPKVYYIRGGPLLANTQEASVDEQVVFPSLTVTQNHAYNSTQDIPGLDGYQGSSNQQGEITIDDDHLFLTQSQRSMHHYDYPKLQEDLYAGETDSLGYQSINNMF